MKRIYTLTISMMLIILGLASCGNMEPENPGTKLNIELNPQQCRMVEKGNDFSGALLSNMVKENESLIISPFSLQILMGMLSNGASEEVYAEIASALGLNDSSLEELNRYFATMTEGIAKEDDPKVKLSMANSAWIQRGLAVKDQFTKTVNDIYHSPVNSADFQNLEQTINSIDRWADAATNGLIPQLELPIDESTQMVLANALYFAGDWTEPFNEDNTRTDIFYREDGTTRKAVFMHGLKEEAVYQETDEFQRVELSFGNGSFSMVVALPKEGTSLSDLLSDSRWMAKEGLQPASVVLTMPKFKLDNRVELMESLEKMGIRQLFQSNSLPGIAEDLLITFIQQNAYFEIDESGVKAAAVSSSGMDLMAPPAPTLVEMNVNRPFVFAICENSSHAVLFAGKVADV